MYLRSIRLENIRGFKELELDFTRPDGSLAGWTVIAGRNGSGKSSVLRAITLNFLGALAPTSVWLGKRNFVFRSASEGSVKADFVEHGVSVFNRATRWKGSAQLISSPTRGTWRTELGTDGFSRKAANRICLIGYGARRRVNGQSSSSEDQPSDIARVQTLFDEDASLREAIDWLRNEIYLRRLEGDVLAARIEELVLEILNDGLLPDGARVVKVDSSGLWIELGGIELPLAEMADGFRVVASLVLDIVSRLYEQYGDLEVERDSSTRAVLSPAIVLVDEVELHLHVTWQRRIGFWLKEHFPNIQFIVTTQSPFVCQAADPGGLIRLSGPGDSKPAEHVPEDVYYTVVNGSLDDAVLTELFGLESAFTEPAEAIRERIAVLEVAAQDRELEAGEIEELQALRKKMPRSMSSDVEHAIRRLAKTA